MYKLNQNHNFTTATVDIRHDTWVHDMKLKNKNEEKEKWKTYHFGISWHSRERIFKQSIDCR